MSQWIKCSDRLPDLGKRVLVCENDGTTMRVAVLYNSDDDDDPGCYWIAEVYHGDSVGLEFEYWMPLPPPPEDLPCPPTP